MKKERTYTKTITEQEFYCDICGKKLTEQEKKYWSPYAVLHYADIYNGKVYDSHNEYSTYLDLCEECNEKVTNVVLYQFNDFTKKVSSENLVKLLKEE